MARPKITAPRHSRLARYFFLHPRQAIPGTELTRECRVNALAVCVNDLRALGMHITNTVEGARSFAGEFVLSTYTYHPKAEDAALRKEVGL